MLMHEEETPVFNAQPHYVLQKGDCGYDSIYVCIVVRKGCALGRTFCLPGCLCSIGLRCGVGEMHEDCF